MGSGTIAILDALRCPVWLLHAALENYRAPVGPAL